MTTERVGKRVVQRPAFRATQPRQPGLDRPLAEPTRPQTSSVVVVSPEDLRALIAEAVASAFSQAGKSSGAQVPAYLTSREAAALLGVSERTLQSLRAAGTGPSYVRIGSMIRYRRVDLERSGLSPDPEARLDELLAARPKAKPGPKKLGVDAAPNRLSDLGLDKNDARRARAVASVPREERDGAQFVRGDGGGRS